MENLEGRARRLEVQWGREVRNFMRLVRSSDPDLPVELVCLKLSSSVVCKF